MRLAGQSFICVVLLLLCFSTAWASEQKWVLHHLTRVYFMESPTIWVERLDALDSKSKRDLVPELRKALKDKNPVIREKVARALGRLDQLAADAEDDLRVAADDQVLPVRMAAKKSLARMGVDAQAEIMVLAHEIVEPRSTPGLMGNQSTANERWRAASDLHYMATGSKVHDEDFKPAIPLLLEGLKDPEPGVRAEIAFLLGIISKTTPDAMPTLRNLLKDPESTVRDAASLSLARLGQDTQNVVSDLCQRFSWPHAVSVGPDKDKMTTATARSWAAEKLYFIASGPAVSSKNFEASIPKLIQALQDPDANVRREIARTLGVVGGSARETAPALKKLLGDSNLGVQEAASSALQYYYMEGVLNVE